MAERTGVARLRQAIENQASAGETYFSLTIHEAYAIYDECEDEHAQLAWAKGVPVPKDADGVLVPLGTEELYTDEGEMIPVGDIRFDGYSWNVRSMDSDKLYWVGALHRTERDSWEKLEHDATLAPRDYMQARDIKEHKDGRIAAMMGDLVSRAKALAGRGDD